MSNIHRMIATHQVTRHIILTCPTCNYRVQIDEKTLAKKTLETGGKMDHPHFWSLDGTLAMSLGTGVTPGEPAEQAGEARFH